MLTRTHLLTYMNVICYFLDGSSDGLQMGHTAWAYLPACPEVKCIIHLISVKIILF